MPKKAIFLPLLAAAILFAVILAASTGMSHAGIYQDEFDNLKIEADSERTIINGTVCPGEEIQIKSSALSGLLGGNLASLYTNKQIAIYWKIGDKVVEHTVDKSNLTAARKYTVTGADNGKDITFGTRSLTGDPDYNNVTPSGRLRVNKTVLTTTVKGSKVTVSGATDYVYGFQDLWVGSVTKIFNGTKTFSVTIDMKGQAYGYYTPKVYLRNTRADAILGSTVLVPISSKPAVKAKYFQTYPKYLTFDPSLISRVGVDKLYLEVNGKKYALGNGKKQVKGLKPNKKYTAYLYFTKKVTKDGKSTTLKGPKAKFTVKTGLNKKLAVKSVTISNAKNKKVQVKGKWYQTSNGSWQYLKPRTVNKTTFKVTVKLKKKPGMKGLLIYGKKVKGNKTTYTVTVTEDGKKKGKSVKVPVQGYGNASYGQYTKISYKKVRVR